MQIALLNCYYLSHIITIHFFLSGRFRSSLFEFQKLDFYTLLEKSFQLREISFQLPLSLWYSLRSVYNYFRLVCLSNIVSVWYVMLRWRISTTWPLYLSLGLSNNDSEMLISRERESCILFKLDENLLFFGLGTEKCSINSPKIFGDIIDVRRPWKGQEVM